MLDEGYRLAVTVDRSAIVAACETCNVESLDLFGSVVTDAFDPERSDIDALVTFALAPGQSPLDAYFALKAALEAIFGRTVDLLFDGRMENPYFRAAVDRQRHRIYP